MAEFAPGDVVVLKSGSMRMLVVSVEGDEVAVMWANEGAIGRDTLPLFALNKWEDRGPSQRSGEDRPPFRGGGDRGGPPRGGPGGGRSGGFAGGDRPRFGGGGGKFGGGDRDGDDRKPGGGKPFGGNKFGGDRPAKVGMDGKPKTKKFFRKDDS